MNVFVTGSCGFIFSNFIRKVIYNKMDYSISSIDKISNAHILNNIYQNKNNSFYIGNVCDEHLLDIIFTHEQPDLIIHGAAETSIHSNSVNDYFSNIESTQKILQACVNHKVKRFIYISSIDAIGDNLSAYGLSKKMCEDLVLYYNKKYGLDYNIIRLCQVYGPREFNNKLVPNMVNGIIHNSKVLLANNGKNKKEWLHISEVVNAITSVIESGEINKSYDLFSNDHLDDGKVLELLADIAKIDMEKIMIEPKSDRYYSECMRGDNSILSTGWSQQIPIKTGLEMTFDWYKNNIWWYKKP